MLTKDVTVALKRKPVSIRWRIFGRYALGLVLGMVILSMFNSRAIASQSELIEKFETGDGTYSFVIVSFFDETRIMGNTARFRFDCLGEPDPEDLGCVQSDFQACMCCMWTEAFRDYRLSIDYFRGTFGHGLKRPSEGPYLMPGKHLWFLEADNTSTDSGGPFDIRAGLQLEFDEGLAIDAVYADQDVITGVMIGNGRFTYDLGELKAGQTRTLMVVIDVEEAGDYAISARLNQDLFDPDPSNNLIERSMHVIEERQRLLFPWVSTNDQYSSALVINNPTSEPAYLEFEAIPAGDGLPIMRHSADALPPYGSIQIDAGRLLAGESGVSLERSYAVLVRSNAMVEGSLATVSLESASRLSLAQGNAIKVLDSTVNDTVSYEAVFGYLPTVDELISAPVIVNTGITPSDITMDYYSQTGQHLLSDETTLTALASYTPFATVTNSLVDAGEDVYLIARSSTGSITGLSFIFNAVREPSIGNVTALNPVSDLVLPWVSSNQQFESIVIVNNVGDTSINVDLTARRTSGEPVEATRTIPANGFLKEFASELFPALGDGPGFSVVVQADQPQILGRWVTNNLTTASGRSPAQGVGIALPSSSPAEPQYSETLLFSWTPNLPQLVGAIVITNLGSSATDITLHLFDSQGNRLGESEPRFAGLESYRPVAVLASDLFSSGVEGYVVAVSDGEPLAGVTFLFNPGAEPAIGDAIPLTDFQIP